MTGRSETEGQLRNLVDRATLLESAGDLDAAINLYEEALMAGLINDEVRYNLALLYKQQLLYEDALTLLAACLDSPEYGASAHYASGECQLVLGNLPAAGEHFHQAVSHIALEEVPPDQVAEVEHIFTMAIDTFTSLDQVDRAAELTHTLSQFRALHHGGAVPASPADTPSNPRPTSAAGSGMQRLTFGQSEELTLPSSDPSSFPAPEPPAGPLPGGATEGLGQTGRLGGTGRLRSTYRRLTSDPLEARRQTGSVSLSRGTFASRTALLPTEAVTAAPAYRFATTIVRHPVRVQPAPLQDEGTLAPAIRTLLTRATTDLEAGHLDAAIDACEQVLWEAPDYLPTHLRLAEAYAGQGLIAEAAAKCNELIRVYETRRTPLASEPVYRLLGALAPDDLAPLITMSDLFFTHGGDLAIREDIRALIERADQQGKHDLALDFAERLVGTDASDRQARRLLAGLLVRVDEPSVALSHYQLLLRHEPNDAIATAGANIALTLAEGVVHWPSLERLMTLLRAPGANRAVAEQCAILYERVAAQVDRPVSELRLIAGVLRLFVGNPEQALQHFQLSQRTAGTQMHPLSRFTLAYGLAKVYASLDNPVVEQQWIQRVAELLKDQRVAQFAMRTTPHTYGEPLRTSTLQIALAGSLLRAGQGEKALALLESTSKENPDDPAIRHQLALAYKETGRPGRALDELDELANQQLQAGKLKEMVETLQLMSSVAGDNLEVKTHLVDLYMQRGFPAEALRELDEVAARQEGDGRPAEAADTLRRAADTAWMIGEREHAYTLYDRMLALAPDNVGLRQAYINCLLQGGRRQDAVAQQWSIARTFLEQQRVQETIAALHQVIVLDPRDTAAYNQLGDALASVGEYSQAERVYRRLVRLSPDDQLAKARHAAMALLVKEQTAS